MRLAFCLLPALLAPVFPLSAALDFNSGNIGTSGLAPTTFLFTPTGGSGNYTFSYAPTATPIPGFRVINAPELPSNATVSQLGGLTGLALTTGVMNTTIRLTDNVGGAFVDKAVSFT